MEEAMTNSGPVEEESGFSLGPQDITLDVREFVDPKEVLKVRNEILRDLFGDLAEYCVIPKGFHHCKLETSHISLEELDDESLKHLIEHPQGEIINPEYQHYEAIRLFEGLLAGDPVLCRDRDPLRPLIGSYLCGPPGCGKTHIMSAYALELRNSLDLRLRNFYQFLDKEIAEMIADRIGATANYDSGETPLKVFDLAGDISGEGEAGPDDIFAEKVEVLKQRATLFELKPTDVLYIGFDPLYELWSSPERKSALEALIKVPIVCIDDLHPKNDPDRLALIQHVIERRYEEGQPGTFFTSNIDADALVKNDDELAKRVSSRCGELFYKIDFAGCRDWRIEVRQRKVNIIRAMVRDSLAQEGILPPGESTMMH